MEVDVTCACGEKYHVGYQQQIVHIKCRRCGQLIRVEWPTSPSISQIPKQIPNRFNIFDNVKQKWILLGSAIAIILFVTIVIGGGKSEPPMQTPKKINIAKEKGVNIVIPEAKTVEIPIKTVKPIISLESGTNIVKRAGPKGRGTLKITNGTSSDAVVKIVDVNNRITRNCVYIKANHETVIKNIGPGLCELKFALGEDWDDIGKRFRRVHGYSIFERRLEFSESNKDDHIEWANYEVTLHPVISGNARTSAISEEAFFAD